MTNFPILGSAFRANLLALTNAQRLIDKTTLRLATGLSVTSALDNPQNFFSAQALNSRASDLSRRIDGINSSVSTVKEALHGVKSIEELLHLGTSIATNKLEELRSGSSSLPLAPTVPLNELILASNPNAYWRLNEIAGGSADNLGAIGGAVDGTYTNAPLLGQPALYADGDTSVDFNGIDQGIAIPNHAQINASPQTHRTVELTFNADTTAGRQVLYEEGGTTNALSIYILNGDLYVTGRAGASWGPFNISAPINAGETYHVAFTFDSVATEFIGYVNGAEVGRGTANSALPSHVGNVGIGFMNNA